MSEKFDSGDAPRTITYGQQRNVCLRRIVLANFGNQGFFPPDGEDGQTLSEAMIDGNKETPGTRYECRVADCHYFATFSEWPDLPGLAALEAKGEKTCSVQRCEIAIPRRGSIALESE